MRRDRALQELPERSVDFIVLDVEDFENLRKPPRSWRALGTVKSRAHRGERY